MSNNTLTRHKELNEEPVRQKKIVLLLIIVSALGYFVDVYDMMLFTVVRKKSLLELGVPEVETLSVGLRLLNFQTIGLLIGGIFWGILGDKKGRLTVLFGSIVIYSSANILNGYVTDLWQYEVLRIIAGFGLAGELGAGITIVMESLKKETRTIGATIVASFGLVGAIVAGFVGEHFDWRSAYIVGGVLGIFLLLLRVGVYESSMYKNIRHENIEKGQFLKIFISWNKFSRYMKTILVGLPSYFVLGLLLTIAPEFASEMGIADKINTGHAMMYCFVGFSSADLLCGLLSQKLKSRKAVFYLFNALTVLSILTFFFAPATDLFSFYIRYTFVGFGIGYWAMLVTNAAEQFGTNYRATVTTTVPNFIRAALVPIAFAFETFKDAVGLVNSGVVIGLITVVIALAATYYTKETFHKDLDYIE